MCDKTSISILKNLKAIFLYDCACNETSFHNLFTKYALIFFFFLIQKGNILFFFFFLFLGKTHNFFETVRCIFFNKTVCLR